MLVTSREYKVIVDRAVFADRAGALASILADTEDLAHSLGLHCTGEFDAADPKERSILFLDTPDFTLHQNGLLLRQRIKLKNGDTEYTLKRRTEDRYIAGGEEIGTGKDLKADSKFEEDIGCPFVSRFSYSVTVGLDGHDRLAGDDFPRTLQAACDLFPGLCAVQRDGVPCAPATPLAPVNNQKVLERVFTGPEVHFAPEGQPAAQQPATVALILWSKGKEGRTLTAEYSFRYEDTNETFPRDAAAVARRFYARLQRLDWTQPEATRKTQFMYEKS
jgi:hypothetical protein